MKTISIIFLLLTFLAISATCQSTAVHDLNVKSPDEIKEIVKRFQDPRYAPSFSSALWTVTHDYEDYKHMDAVLKSVISYLESIQKHAGGDPLPLQQLGGIESFKAKLGEWLEDKDPAIRAFAAITIGVSGDREKIPQLLKIMKRNDPDEQFSRIYDKGRAAIAIALLGAVEQKPEILSLLKRKNHYDRSGAITALTLFGAKENAREVAAILGNKDLGYNDDTSPIYFLIETGTATNYKREIASAMSGDSGSEVAEAAMFALVQLNAKEYAPHIAKLLSDRFRKANAAKALALLGATQYTNAIGAMLNDKEELVQSAAAIAIGILKARKYAPRLAVLMNSKSFVNSYAAAALVLMDLPAYSKQASSRLAEFRSKGVYLTVENAFHPLVAEKASIIVQKIKMAKTIK